MKSVSKLLKNILNFQLNSNKRMRFNNKCRSVTNITSNELIRKVIRLQIQRVKARDLNLKAKGTFRLQVSSFLKECFPECPSRTQTKIFFLKQNPKLNFNKLQDQTKITSIICRLISKTKLQNSVQNTLCAKLW